MRLRDFYELLNDSNKFINFLKQESVIPVVSNSSCNHCGNDVSLKIRSRSNGDFFFIRCNKCKRETSLFSNTFFVYTDSANRAPCKLAPKTILEFIYLYCRQFTYEEIEKEINISRPTTVDWANFDQRWVAPIA
jgi:ribosomal protein S27E